MHFFRLQHHLMLLYLAQNRSGNSVSFQTRRDRNWGKGLEEWTEQLHRTSKKFFSPIEYVSEVVKRALRLSPEVRARAGVEWGGEVSGDDDEESEQNEIVENSRIVRFDGICGNVKMRNLLYTRENSSTLLGLCCCLSSKFLWVGCDESESTRLESVRR